MVQEAGGELTVVNVIDPAFSSRPPQDARAYAEDALGRLHGRLPGDLAQWCEVRDVVRFGETSAEILKVVAQEGAQLIVVGAHSRRPAVAAMVGSCADRIVREASCPVLAVPSPLPALAVPLLVSNEAYA
jgi:nucleotide-binding universal stress UspA family protein